MKVSATISQQPHSGKKIKDDKSNLYSVNLKITRSKVALAVLISISLAITAYTASAYYVASHVCESEGRLWWPNSLGGSFYPWPYLPVGLALQVLTELSQADAQYYRHVIKSGVLVALTLLSWATVFWRGWKMRSTRQID